MARFLAEDEEGGNDFRKKENVRRGLMGKIEGLTYVGVWRTSEKLIQAQLF